MKPICFLRYLLLIPLFVSFHLCAQQKISFDLGAIRQKNHHNGGLNVSGFYHINEHWLGGVELNRFFPVYRTIENEVVQLSGWDVEINFHYLFPLGKEIKLYPVTGISHTSEKELMDDTHEKLNDRFWSVNTGAGFFVELGHWLPHVEYIFTWGHTNQEFILVGVGYEIEWGHHKTRHSK